MKCLLQFKKMFDKINKIIIAINKIIITIIDIHYGGRRGRICTTNLIMALIIWSFGVVTGIIIFICTAVLFTFKLFMQQKLNRKLPQFIKPKEVID